MKWFHGSLFVHFYRKKHKLKKNGTCISIKFNDKWFLDSFSNKNNIITVQEKIYYRKGADCALV